MILEILARANRKGKEIKDIQIEKEEVMLNIYAQMTILYRENPQRIHKRDPRANKRIQQSCRVQDQHTKTSCVSVQQQ